MNNHVKVAKYLFDYLEQEKDHYREYPPMWMILEGLDAYEATNV